MISRGTRYIWYYQFQRITGLDQEYLMCVIEEKHTYYRESNTNVPPFETLIQVIAFGIHIVDFELNQFLNLPFRLALIW